MVGLTPLGSVLPYRPKLRHDSTFRAINVVGPGFYGVWISGFLGPDTRRSEWKDGVTRRSFVVRSSTCSRRVAASRRA